MKLSIIIPVYNPPKKIFESTMNSVLTQGYGDLEIILVDDGSKSEIANLIDGYEKNLKK
ncbi:glycosyltransferase family 2 protein [Longibaculum muris]|uniref:glycosyltransferase family 2 protein n=1 Tax=Longibaculum muris TaxID=1796628 RepID=UPI003AB8287F